MKYVIHEYQFKSLGFTFQKLYASNYKCYWMDNISACQHRIWCWVLGKDIELDSFGRHTESVIYAFKTNRTNPNAFMSRKVDDSDYMQLLLNRDTGEVITRHQAVLNWGGGDYLKFLDVQCEQKDWNEVVLVPEDFDVALEVIDILQGRK